MTGVAKQGRDRIVDSGRTADPSVVHVDTPTGQERILASAVVDASGTASRRSQQAEAAATSGHVTNVTPFRTESVTAQADGRLTLTSVNGQQVSDVDEVIVVTGSRPDLSFLSEVRLDLDPVLSSARALAGEIDPPFHSCGDVSPHGYKELAQPEESLFIIGTKTYGRAPSFLAMTGVEQVRSVVAALDGDLEAAGRVELVLPETGVYGGSGLFDEPAAAGGCCGACRRGT